jgi:hypothetical protein
MRITIDTLEEFGACERGKDKFCELFPSGWCGEWTLDKQLEMIRSPLRIFADWAFKTRLVPMLSMEEVNLSMADLSGVDLHGANLTGRTCLGRTFTVRTCLGRTFTGLTCLGRTYTVRTCLGRTCPMRTCRMRTCTLQKKLKSGFRPNVSRSER